MPEQHEVGACGLQRLGARDHRSAASASRPWTGSRRSCAPTAASVKVRAEPRGRGRRELDDVDLDGPPSSLTISAPPSCISRTALARRRASGSLRTAGRPISSGAAGRARPRSAAVVQTMSSIVTGTVVSCPGSPCRANRRPAPRRCRPRRRPAPRSRVVAGQAGDLSPSAFIRCRVESDTGGRAESRICKAVVHGDVLSERRWRRDCNRDGRASSDGSRQQFLEVGGAADRVDGRRVDDQQRCPRRSRKRSARRPGLPR